MFPKKSRIPIDLTDHCDSMFHHMKTIYSTTVVALIISAIGTCGTFAQDAGVKLDGPPQKTAPQDNLPIGVPIPGTPDASAPDASHGIRLSAIIKADDIIKVGLIDMKDGRNRFLSEGDTFNNMLIVSADYDEEIVILKSENGEIITLTLAGDPNADHSAPNYNPLDLDSIWKGEGIESFLKEHPNAIVKAGPSLKSLGYKPGPPVEGLGPGIEAFIKDDAERERLMRPAVGRGEGIESYLREHPELEAQLNQPVTGLGPGIESYMNEHPEVRAQLSNKTSGASSDLGPGIEAMRKQLEAEGSLPKPGTE